MPVFHTQHTFSTVTFGSRGNIKRQRGIRNNIAKKAQHLVIFWVFIVHKNKTQCQICNRLTVPNVPSFLVWWSGLVACMSNLVKYILVRNGLVTDDCMVRSGMVWSCLGKVPHLWSLGRIWQPFCHGDKQRRQTKGDPRASLVLTGESGRVLQ